MAFWKKTPSASEDVRSDEVSRLADRAVEAFGISGGEHLLRRDETDTAPAAGEARAAWIRERVLTSFDIPITRKAYVLDEDIDRAIHRRLRDERRMDALLVGAESLHRANERVALAMASRYASLLRGGVDMVRRVETETTLLDEAQQAVIAARFAHTPPARMDALPTDQIRRRQWLRDTLIVEGAAILSGRIRAQHVAAMAATSLLPADHRRNADGSPIIARAIAHQEGGEGERIDMQATNLSGQSDEALASRFGALPGCGTPPSDREARMRWIRLALKVEAGRRLAGLSGTDRAARPLSITLSDVDVREDGSFGTDLMVDGERICRMVSPGDGVIEAEAWTDGCTPADLAILDAYIGATGAPRDDGGLPDSLALTILDLVTMDLVVKDFARAAERAVIFTIEGEGGLELLSIAIPEGGSREGARAAMLAAHPDAAALDDMAPEDAALLWAALA